MRFILVCLAAVLLTCGGVRAAETARAGDATFTPPDDWAVKTQPDGLVRIVSPDENAMILVMPGNPYDGDLQDAFDKSAATFAALAQARRHVVDTHHCLDTTKVQIGLRTLAFGNEPGKPPPGGGGVETEFERIDRQAA